MKKTLNLLIFISITLSVFSQKENAKILDDYFGRSSEEKVYESKDEFVPIEVGQWVILRKYEGNKETPVLLKYSVVDKQGDNFWIEVKDVRKKKTIVAKFLIEGIQGSSFSGSKTIDGKFTQNGEPGHTMWSVFSMYLYPLQGLGKAEPLNADVTVVSGTYKNVWGHSGSFKRETSVDGPGISIDLKSEESGIIFYHPAIPLGVVGWNSTNDRAEVIEFGFTGAESEIE